MAKERNFTLTKSEFRVMDILWRSGKACDVHEIVESFVDSQPVYSTISSFLRILSVKGFVGYRKGVGKQHLYFPLISKAEYTSRVMHDVKNNFFGGSVSSLLSFFLKEENLSSKELEELIATVNRED